MGGAPVEGALDGAPQKLGKAGSVVGEGGDGEALDGVVVEVAVLVLDNEGAFGGERNDL